MFNICNAPFHKGYNPIQHKAESLDDAPLILDRLINIVIMDCFQSWTPEDQSSNQYQTWAVSMTLWIQQMVLHSTLKQLIM